MNGKLFKHYVMYYAFDKELKILNFRNGSTTRHIPGIIRAIPSHSVIEYVCAPSKSHVFLK